MRPQQHPACASLNSLPPGYGQYLLPGVSSFYPLPRIDCLFWVGGLNLHSPHHRHGFRIRQDLSPEEDCYWKTSSNGNGQPYSSGIVVWVYPPMLRDFCGKTKEISSLYGREPVRRSTSPKIARFANGGKDGLPERIGARRSRRSLLSRLVLLV